MKEIVDAQADNKGNITSVRFAGNQRFTNIKKAIEMVDRGEISNAHSVHPKKTKSYLRTNADGRKKNNLDDMAGV